MELRQLHYFVAVAEELHFGRAAARLHMAQPPLSRQIRQLEQELGVQLLERTTRRVALTPAGETYLQRCRHLLAEVEAAGVEASRVAAGEVGRVVVGVVGSVTYAVLPVVARRLREDFPDLDVEYTGEMLTPDQVVGLREGELDVALMRAPVPAQGLRVRVLSSEELVVALPATHPLARRSTIALELLRDEPFVAYPSGHRSVLHDVVFGACQRAGFRPRQVAQVTQTSTLLVFVASGLGVAVIPASAARLRLEGVTFVPVEDSPRVELAIGWRPDASPAAHRVVDHLTAVLRESL